MGFAGGNGGGIHITPDSRGEGDGVKLSSSSAGGSQRLLIRQRPKENSLASAWVMCLILFPQAPSDKNPRYHYQSYLPQTDSETQTRNRRD